MLDTDTVARLIRLAEAAREGGETDGLAYEDALAALSDDEFMAYIATRYGIED